MTVCLSIREPVRQFLKYRFKICTLSFVPNNLFICQFQVVVWKTLLFVKIASQNLAPKATLQSPHKLFRTVLYSIYSFKLTDKSQDMDLHKEIFFLIQ